MARGPIARPISVERVRERLRWEVNKCGGVKAWCAQNECAWQTVYAVIAGTKPPGQKILSALGLRHVEGLYEHVPAEEICQ